MSREPEQDGWLGSTLRPSPAAVTDACPDAETLAAWADGGLTTQAAAAVDLHASNCSRCMAVLAAIERSAPPALAPHAWTPARLFRWLVPLTAAATAIAIWVAVPDRPIAPQQTAAVQDLGTTSERGDSASQVPGPVPVPAPERGTQNQNPASSAQNPEQPSARSKSLPAPEAMRDDLRRERGAAESLDAAVGAAPVEEAPPAAPPAAAAPLPAARSAPSAGTLAETARTTQRSAFTAAAPMEFAAPSNASVRWRVIGPASIQRTTDDGGTWTSATPPPGVASDKPAGLSVVALRVVDAERAVVRTSDGRESYTTNGGRSWTLVQENSKAPF